MFRVFGFPGWSKNSQLPTRTQNSDRRENLLSHHVPSKVDKWHVDSLAVVAVTLESRCPRRWMQWCVRRLKDERISENFGIIFQTTPNKISQDRAVGRVKEGKKVWTQEPARAVNEPWWCLQNHVTSAASGSKRAGSDFHREGKTPCPEKSGIFFFALKTCWIKSRNWRFQSLGDILQEWV